MKKLVYLSILLVLVLPALAGRPGGTFSVAMAQSPQQPTAPRSGMASGVPGAEQPVVPNSRWTLAGMPGGGVQNVSGSTVNYVSPDLLPTGQPFDLCFNITEYSLDWEYMDGFDVQLPMNWTVNYVIDTPCTSCFSGHTFGVTDNKVWWYTIGMPSQMGDWCAGTYDFCANVTIPDCSGSPWDLAWNIWGDTWGNPPHSVSGMVQKSCLVPGVYVTPFTQSGNACVGENADYTLNLFNNSGQDGAFAVTVADTWGMTCPATVSAAAGATVPFACTVRVPCAGGSDTAAVTAAGNGYSGSAAVTSSNLDGWAAEPPSPLPVMDNAAISYDGKLYVVGGWGAYGAVQIWDGSAWTVGAASGLNGEEGDACLGLDAGGHPVIDLFGDTYHYVSIERYDIDADSWSSFPYPAGYPATGLAMPDIVSMLQHTGQNVCYISGGATTWGGGDTSTLYAYYPDTQTVVNLGDYTLHPDGFAWHFSWWVPWVGAQGGICVAGGFDVNWVVVGDSQCYDLATGAFNAPGADLGPLPQPWDQGADGWRINEAGQYEIWGYGGSDANGNTLQQSFVNSGSGFAYGPVPLYPTFRMEGDNFSGSVWAANGLTGWLYPVTLQESFAQCPACAEHTSHINKSKINAAPAGRPGYYKVVFAARIWDESKHALPEATVLGTWTYPDGSPHDKTAVTDALGRVKFPIKEHQTGTYTFCVTDIQKAGYGYDPNGNTNPACRSVTVVP